MLKKKADILYKRSKLYDYDAHRELKVVFGTKKQKREKVMKKWVGALDIWIKLAESVLTTVDKEVKKQNGIERWLNREQTYQIN